MYAGVCNVQQRMAGHQEQYASPEGVFWLLWYQGGQTCQDSDSWPDF